MYNNLSEIRIGVVNDDSKLIENERFNEPKIKIVCFGTSNCYERLTLKHMKISSDKEDVIYWYLHTKGIKHFGTQYENNVIDWINLMLFWNIEKWRDIPLILDNYDTYGCNFTGSHYSGNFWVSKSNHIKNLPLYIGEKYTDPEHWISSIKGKYYNSFSSGFQGMGHYYNLFPRKNYVNLNNISYQSKSKQKNILKIKKCKSNLKF